MIGHDAVEGGEDFGETKVDARGLEVRLIDFNRALVLLHDEGLVLRLLPRNGVLLLQSLIASQIDLRHGEHRLVVRQLSFGLIDLRLIKIALDAEELRSLGDRGAVLVIDRFQKTLNAGDQIHAPEGRSIAGQLEIQGHWLLHGLCDRDFWRWRLDESVSRAAACHSNTSNCCKDGQAKPPAFPRRRREPSHGHFIH